MQHFESNNLVNTHIQLGISYYSMPLVSGSVLQKNMAIFIRRLFKGRPFLGTSERSMGLLCSLPLHSHSNGRLYLNPVDISSILGHHLEPGASECPSDVHFSV